MFVRLYAVEKYSIVEHFRIAVFFYAIIVITFVVRYFSTILSHIFIFLSFARKLRMQLHTGSETNANVKLTQKKVFSNNYRFLNVRASSCKNERYKIFFSANSIYLFLFCIRLSGKNCDRNGQGRSKGCPLIPAYFY